jgi:hypothetical protein
MQARAYRDRLTLAARLTLAGAFLAGGLAACGGYGGSNNYMGGGGGGITCGGTYGVTCPPPAVTLTAPAAGATVKGMVTLTATAMASSTYNLTITSVAFMVDATAVGTATTAPYSVSWDSTKVANGSHQITAKATDNAGDTATTTVAVNVTVGNAAIAVAMSPSQVFPVLDSKASGTARLMLQSETGAVSGQVALSGFTARAVTLNEGFAGSTGQTLIALEPGAAAGEWQVPAGALLTAQQRSALAQGRLYLVATSAAHPAGEVRGQIAPDNVQVTFSELAATPEAATLDGAFSGVAATTVDTQAGTLTVNVNSTGVEAATSATLDTGAAGAGATRIALTRDPADVNHWSKELARIGAADVDALEAGEGSVSVASQAAPGGALRGEIY